MLRLRALLPVVVVYRQQPLSRQRVHRRAHLHAVRHVQCLAFRRGQRRVYFELNVILHVHKALLRIAHVHQIVVTRVVHQSVVTVYLHLELLHHDTAHMSQQRYRRAVPFRVPEPCLVPSCHHIPKSIHRAEYHKLHPSAHLVAFLDGDRNTLRIDAQLIAHVILQVKLCPHQFIADLRVKADGETLLVVLVLVGTLLQRLVLPPLKVRHLPLRALFHHAFVADYQHTRQHAYLRYVVAAVTYGTVLELIFLRPRVRERHKTVLRANVPCRLPVRSVRLPPLLRVVPTIPVVTARHRHMPPLVDAGKQRIAAPYSTIVVIYRPVSVRHLHHGVQHQLSAQHDVVRRTLVRRREHAARYVAVIDGPRYARLQRVRIRVSRRLLVVAVPVHAHHKIVCHLHLRDR